jgi:hypothetical protein
MVNWSSKPSDLSYTKPFAAPNDVPELPQASVTPTRLSHSYSDMTYEWAVFRTTGRTLDDYKPLAMAAKRMKEWRTRAKAEQVLSTGNDDTIEDTDEEELGQEVFTEDARVSTIERLWLYLSYSLGFNESGAHLVRPITSLLYSDYFYRNVWVYSLAWFAFYFQEYVYVWLSLHFPFLEFLTLYPIYDWPAHIDMYFGRLIFAAFFTVYFLCFFFQYRVGVSSKFDQYGAAAQFVAFFGSALLYYQTGLAPFLLLSGLVVCFAVPYTFYYFVPRRLIGLQLQPPLALPAPSRAPVLYLPKYWYRYPYFSVAQSGGMQKRFTAYPFTTQVQRLAASQRFIRRVLVHDYFSVMTFPTWSSTQQRTPPLWTGPFETWYGFNPYDTYEESFMNRSAIINDFSDINEKRRMAQVYHGLEQRVVRFADEDIEHSDAFVFEFPDRFYSEERFPPWMNNTTFFSRSIRQTTRSLYRNHFTSDDSTSFFASGPRPALWQIHLLKDPYFGLYMWLKHTAPVVQRASPSFDCSPLFSQAYTVPPEQHIYPRFSAFIRLFYRVLARLFDYLTFGRYRRFEFSWATTTELGQRARWLGRYTSRMFFRPTTDFLRATVRFCLKLEARLDKDESFCRFISRTPGFRHTLLHHLGVLWVGLSELSLRSYVRRRPLLYLLLRTSLRVLPRVLFRLTRLHPFI